MGRLASKGNTDTDLTPQSNALGMTTRRALLANAVIVLLVIGSLFTIVFDKEYWPFSQYPMYSELHQKDELSRLQLYGVTKEEPHDEIPMRDEYLSPLSPSRVLTAFRRLNSTGNSTEKRQESVNRALLDSLEFYEKRRQAEWHDGPALQGIRLYEVRWQLDAKAENVDQPEYRELVTEVEQQ
jgi:hypothetical protein